MAAIEGDLPNVGLPQALEAVASQGKSGILTVQGTEDIVAVSFLEGRVVSADALNETVEDVLGAVLEEQGLVSAMDFEAVSRDHEGGSAGSLGDLLVSRGLISREELLRALRIQTCKVMFKILGWSGIEQLTFYGGDEISYEEGFEPLSVEEILLRSIGKVEGPGGLEGPVPEGNAVYRKVPPRGAVKIIGQDGDGLTGGPWLSRNQAMFLSRLDGKSSAVAHGEAVGLDSHGVLFALYKLLRLDLAEIEEASQAGVARPAQARPAQARPAQARPAQARPAQARPAQARPAQAAPAAVADSPAASTKTPPAMSSPTESAPPGTAQIFVPPDDLGDDWDGEELPAIAPSSVLHRFIGPLLAALAFFALGGVFFAKPTQLLMPFPWQDSQRSTVHQHFRQALYGKIEQATKSYFLVQAHYPDSLQELVSLGLLTTSDLRGPEGNRLDYATNEVGYHIEPLTTEETMEGLGATVALRDDFLLNRGLLRSVSTDSDPLVLID
jgi:hypothetical protein